MQIQEVREEQYHISQRQYQNLSAKLLKNIKEGLQVQTTTGLVLQQGRYPQKQDLKSRNPQRKDHPGRDGFPQARLLTKILRFF